MTSIATLSNKLVTVDLLSKKPRYFTEIILLKAEKMNGYNDSNNLLQNYNFRTKLAIFPKQKSSSTSTSIFNSSITSDFYLIIASLFFISLDRRFRTFLSSIFSLRFNCGLMEPNRVPKSGKTRIWVNWATDYKTNDNVFICLRC